MAEIKDLEAVLRKLVGARELFELELRAPPRIQISSGLHLPKEQRRRYG